MKGMVLYMSSDDLKEQLEAIKQMIASNRRKIRQRTVNEASLFDEQVAVCRKDIAWLKSIALKLGYRVVDVPGVDFDDPVNTDIDVTIKMKLSTYKRIKAIVAQHGIELPDLER